ncbi:MAG: nucleotide pyrophosphohydrolase [Lachnospiraceae bacterium]|nr:nucleotide pyrophosphohydrolase [Lachnospiraceae bacterium]
MTKDIEQLQDAIKNFCLDRDWDQFHNPKDLAIGLSTESNELLDIFRFRSEDQMKLMMKDEHKREHISEELGDIFFFLLRFAQMNGFDLEQCLTDKLEKNNQKYPAEQVKGKNLKYTEY